MPIITFAPELITAAVAMICSLIFSYFSPVAEWYAGLKSHFKSLIMLALMLIVTVAIVLLVQYGVITSAEPITWQLAVYYFILAVIANASAYTISPQTDKVKQLKAAREVKPIIEAVEPAKPVAKKRSVPKGKG